MQITLKNGETVRLTWNWLTVERIEEVVGSLEGLTEKGMKKRGQAKTAGDIVYAVVQSSLDKEYPRNHLLSLIDVDDFEKIIEFVAKNEDETKETVGDIKK